MNITVIIYSYSKVKPGHFIWAGLFCCFNMRIDK